MGGLCQLERVGDECVLAYVEGRGERVTLNGGEQVIVFGERTESLPVMAHSIVAVVDRRDRDSDHLALGARQF